MCSSDLANLGLLNRFFTKYPEYRDRAFIAVKVMLLLASKLHFSCADHPFHQGALKAGRPDGSPEVLRERCDLFFFLVCGV